jgi:tetratricopeptide (TPR) repeat protein
MARDLKEYRIFFASPEGLQKERLAFRDIIAEYNESESGQRGVHFVAVGWEDTQPGIGRPQAKINEEIRTSDYFLLMFWDRWGTPPNGAENSPYTSGTEEEYYVAKGCYDDPQHSLREIAVFFKGVSPAQLNDPGLQLEAVLRFRKKLEASRELLFRAFDRDAEFERHLRRLLAQWRRDHEDGNLGKGRSGSPRLPLMPPPSDEISFPKSTSPNQALLEEAWRCAEAGRLTEAETLFARSAARGNDPEAFRSYGSFLLRAGRRAQAEVMYDRILELASASDRTWQAIAYGNIGLVRELSDDFVGAEEMYRKSLAIHQELGDLDGVAQVQNNLGIIENRKGHFARAEQLYHLALENGRKANRDDIVGRAYNNLGLLYRDKREFEQSERAHLEALAIAERRGRTQEIATACANLGVLNVDWGKLVAAGEMFSRSLLLSRQLGFQEGIAISSAGLGAVFLSQGNAERAELSFREALNINIQMERSDGVASALLNLGVIEVQRSQLESAERFLQAALSTYSEIGEPAGQATSEEYLGEVYRGRGDTEKARQLWNQAHQRFEKMGLSARAEGILKRLRALG